jgi:hypothetical protein
MEYEIHIFPFNEDITLLIPFLNLTYPCSISLPISLVSVC